MAGTKLSEAELEERVREAYQLRYEKKLTQRQYVEYAKDKYGDKSEQQYCQYFLKAKEIVNKNWDERLDNLLGPAVDELTRLLSSESERIRQKAVDQIVEYAGKKIKKVEQDITSGGEQIKVGFSSDE